MTTSISPELRKLYMLSLLRSILCIYMKKILIEVSQQSTMELLFNINRVSLLYVHILANDGFREYTNDTVFIVVPTSTSTMAKILVPSWDAVKSDCHISVLCYICCLLKPFYFIVCVYVRQGLM